MIKKNWTIEDIPDLQGKIIIVTGGNSGLGLASVKALAAKNAELNSARQEKGTLLASGFIAGGALMGVVSAGLRFAGVNVMNMEWAESNSAQWLGLFMYVLLSGYLIWDAMRVKNNK